MKKAQKSIHFEIPGKTLFPLLALVKFNCDPPKINFKIYLHLQFFKWSLEI